MARKIIIDFSAQPVIGKGFEYSIYINGVALVYQNGATAINFDYSSNPNTDSNIELQPDLNTTIDNTLAWLASRYVSVAIIYSRVGNTIEVLLNSPEYLVVTFGDSNINITTTSAAVPEPGVNLKYYLQYTNIVGDEYLCNIYKKDYTGTSTEIHGKAIIDKGAVKDHLEPIRGGGITLELEADLNITLEDLYTENEQDFTVKLYRNNKLIFSGYLNPEGVFQSFVIDSWVISLDCVDGLGAIKNLSFVDPLGFPFTGKMKAIDIVYYCLNRSGIVLPINVSINTTYEGLPIDSDTEILSKIYLNVNRYQKTDGDTIMSCEEVLKSVLDLFCACITQKDGEWYIYKPNEIFIDRNVIFKIYDINNVYLGRKTVKLDYALGSHINNFYPHHCNGDQKIQMKGGNSSFRINYKYGFLASLLENSSLVHNNLSYDGWTINNPPSLINNPARKSGFYVYTVSSSSNLLVATSDPVFLNAGNKIEFSVNVSIVNQARFKFKVVNGSSYLNNQGEWSSDPNTYVDFSVETLYQSSTSFSLVSAELPSTANTYVQVFAPQRTTAFSVNIGFIQSIGLVNKTGDGNIVGEFHTASRATRISSNIKDNKTIYNGDSNGFVYLGIIYKEDQNTPTTEWNRKNSYEKSQILKIAAEEELRISQKPLKIFEGSTYGQLPYLSAISINGINGLFMPIEYTYDTVTNVAKMKLLELFCTEIADLVYKLTFDYGETSKPTIQG